MNLDIAPTVRAVAEGVPGPDPAPASRRTRNRQERRDRVFEAAVHLFVEQGFEATSMDDIAVRSELARTTVFNHFPRKVSLLEEWTLRRRQRAARSFGDAPLTGRSVRDVLGGYFAALAALNEETREETTALMPLAVKHTDVFVDHPLFGDLAGLVSDTAAALRPVADPTRVGRLLALGYFSAVTRWIAVDPAPFDLTHELTAVLDTVLDGALAR